jgi:hypothetical protein
MNTYKLAIPKFDQRINNLVELISDLKDSTSAEPEDNFEQATPVVDNNNPNRPRTSSTPKPTSRQLSLKVSLKRALKKSSF